MAAHELPWPVVPGRHVGADDLREFAGLSNTPPPEAQAARRLADLLEPQGPTSDPWDL